MDQRVLDLHKENKELQAKVAWYEYGEKILEELLARANGVYYGGGCQYIGCYHSKRFDTSDWLDGFPKSFMSRDLKTNDNVKRKLCLIKKCLLLHVEKIGFEVANLNAKSFRFVPNPDKPQLSIGVDLPADPVPASCHLIIWNQPDNSYWTVEYGPKLCSKDFL